MSQSLEYQVETAVIAALAAAYPTRTVRRWADATNATSLPCIAVRVLPRELLAKNYLMVKMQLHIVAMSHHGDDAAGAQLDQLYAEARAWLDGIGAAALSVYGLTMDGVVPLGGADVDAALDDSIQLRGCMADMFGTTYATTTTTTTTTSTTTTTTTTT